MNRLKSPAIGIALFAAAVGMAQLHPFGNPRGEPRQPRSALLANAQLPNDAKRVLVAKCADCHSDATSWPIYSYVAPASWLIERDVVEGREHLNLSRWQDLSRDRQLALAQEIVRQVRKNDMPPLPYRLLHASAALKPAEVAALSALAPDEPVETVPLSQGDAARGNAVFERRCTGCHALDSDREGPHLRGVYGRTAGSVPGFQYSSAIRKSGLIWTDVNIERWLRDTDAMVPGSNMGFSVPKAQERADVVAFLKSLR